MKNAVSVLVCASLLSLGLVSCPAEKITPPAEVVTTELILNGSFESQKADWIVKGSAFTATVPDVCVKTGKNFLVLRATSESAESFSQTINVPAQGTTVLKYWVRIEAWLPASNSFDNLVVSVNSNVINTMTPANERKIYNEYSYDLTAFAGKPVTLEFKGTFSRGESGLFCIDDVSAVNSK